MRGKLDNPVLIAGLGIAGLLLGGYSAPDRRAPASPGRGNAAGSARDATSSGAAGRGHDAERPSDIPARGWWDIAKRVVAQVSDDRLLTEAAGVTFFALLALFPALAAMISIYGLFADPGDDVGSPGAARPAHAGRRDGHHQGAGQALTSGRQQGARLRRRVRPRHLAVERQPGDEGAVRRAERRLRRAARTRSFFRRTPTTWPSPWARCCSWCWR